MLIVVLDTIRPVKKKKKLLQKKASNDNQFKAEQLWVICISPVAHQLTDRLSAIAISVGI